MTPIDEVQPANEILRWYLNLNYEKRQRVSGLINWGYLVTQFLYENGISREMVKELVNE